MRTATVHYDDLYSNENWGGDRVQITAIAANGLALMPGKASVPLNRVEEAVEFYKRQPHVAMIGVYRPVAEKFADIVVHKGRPSERRVAVTRDRLITHIRGSEIRGPGPIRHQWSVVDSWDMEKCPGTETDEEMLVRVEKEAIAQADQSQAHHESMRGTPSPTPLSDLELFAPEGEEA